MNYDLYQGFGANKTNGARRDLTFLDETSEWVEQVLCLARDTGAHHADQILGGSDGIANAPAQALANRTLYLRNSVQQLAAMIRSLTNLLAPTLSAMKNLVVAANKPSDTAHKAWLKMESGWTYSEQPTFRLTLKAPTDIAAAAVENPTFRVVLDDGTVYYLRTDGQSVDPGDVGTL